MLTAKQVGPLLGLSPRKVYELAKSGTLASYRFGRAIRYAEADVEAYRLAHQSPQPRVLTPREQRTWERLRRAAEIDPC
jgi:excisionase family DNA binding protein